MTSEEQARSRLHHTLEGAIGEEGASTIMERLPPRSWTEIATKRDLESFEERLSGRIDGLDEQLSGRIGDLDERLSGQIGELYERVCADADAREQRLSSDLEAREHRIRGTIHKEMTDLFASQTRMIAFTLLGTLTAHSLALIAAIRIP